ncbi:hypothetical protein O9929_24100 [Vibrio lentus]|nr:hypothetical protein [Vibrio lentus]
MQRGFDTWATLDGGLEVLRRAPKLFLKKLEANASINDPMEIMDWINLLPLRRDENAAGESHRIWRYHQLSNCCWRYSSRGIDVLHRFIKLNTSS